MNPFEKSNEINCAEIIKKYGCDKVKLIADFTYGRDCVYECVNV